MSRLITDRTTRLKLSIKPGESISVTGPTRIKVVKTASGRAEIVFIGPESTQIHRHGLYVADGD